MLIPTLKCNILRRGKLDYSTKCIHHGWMHQGLSTKTLFLSHIQ